MKCKVPYHPVFIAELKHRVEWRLRAFSRSEKAWLVDPSVNELKEIVLKYFPHAIFETLEEHNRRVGVKDVRSQPREPAPEVDLGEDDSLKDGTYGTMATLLRVASPDALKQIFRLLAVDLHPDHGGDVETMKLLNTAWDQIRREREIQ